jgi:hypothetical protein
MERPDRLVFDDRGPATPIREHLMLPNSALHLVLCCAIGQAAPETDAGKAAAAKALAQFKGEAAGYDVRLESDPDTRLELVKEPVLRWTNPARTGEDGALFIWTRRGRPELIGTIFTYVYNNKLSRKHELMSLAEGPLTAQFGGKEVWSPKSAGVNFLPLEKAPDVAANSRQRLTQMKSLARDFAASMRDLQGEQFQLRLLTQPLVRYEPDPGGSRPSRVLDGAIFAFSLGTDPEVLLLLEARPQEEGHAWHYALARFHYIDLTVKHNDRQVWHADPLADYENLDLGAAKYRDQPYATFHVERGR